jgi:hypothetical protein
MFDWRSYFELRPNLSSVRFLVGRPFDPCRQFGAPLYLANIVTWRLSRTSWVTSRGSALCTEEIWDSKAHRDRPSLNCQLNSFTCDIWRFNLRHHNQTKTVGYISPISNSSLDAISDRNISSVINQCFDRNDFFAKSWRVKSKRFTEIDRKKD